MKKLIAALAFLTAQETMATPQRCPVAGVPGNAEQPWSGAAAAHPQQLCDDLLK